MFSHDVFFLLWAGSPTHSLSALSLQIAATAAAEAPGAGFWEGGPPLLQDGLNPDRDMPHGGCRHCWLMSIGIDEGIKNRVVFFSRRKWNDSALFCRWWPCVSSWCWVPFPPACPLCPSSATPPQHRPHPPLGPRPPHCRRRISTPPLRVGRHCLLSP